MKCITFKEFCDERGYHPYNKNPSKTLSVLAKIIGVSNADVSKLYNGKPFEYGARWNKVESFIAAYGYKLISSNHMDLISNNIIKENKKIKTENDQLKHENQLLKLEIEALKEFVRISKRIAEYDNDRRTIVCKK